MESGQPSAPHGSGTACREHGALTSGKSVVTVRGRGRGSPAGLAAAGIRSSFERDGGGLSKGTGLREALQRPAGEA